MAAPTPPRQGGNGQPSRSYRRGLHRLILAVLMTLGLARGSYWALTAEVWSPIDETAHFGYVESLATFEGIPTVGEDLVSEDVLALAKESPTYYFRSQPVAPDVDDDRWGGTRHNFEAIHGPVFYAAVVPVYWASSPFGLLATIYSLRIAAVALSLLALPLTWLLAKVLFPRQPLVWLLAPALLVVVQGFNANVATITNDALVIPLSAACLVMLIRALERRSTRGAAWAGVVMGLALLTKSSSLAIVPLLIVVWLRAVLGRERAVAWPRAVGIAGGFVATVAIVVAPWVWWNVATYDALTASEAVAPLTIDPALYTDDWLSAIGTNLQAALRGSLEFQPATLLADVQDTPIGAITDYRAFWALAAGLGVAWALVRRRHWRRGERANLVLVAMALPAAAAVLLTIQITVFDVSAALTGRHLYAALPASAIAVAAALVIGRRRLGPLLVGGLIVTSLWLEVGVVHGYIDRQYETGVVGDSAPIVEQTWNDGFVEVAAVTAEVDCSATGVGLAVQPTRRTLRVTGRGGASTFARLKFDTTGPIRRYAFDEPLPGPIRVELPPSTVLGRSRRERSAALDMDGAGGDPVASVLCPVEDPGAHRFEQRFRPLHPAWLSRALVRSIPVAQAIVGTEMFVVLCGWTAFSALRARRSPAAPR